MKNIKKIIFILLLSMFCIPDVKAALFQACNANSGTVKTWVSNGKLEIEWYNFSEPFVTNPYSWFALADGAHCGGGHPSNVINGNVSIPGVATGDVVRLTGNDAEYYGSQGYPSNATVPYNALANFTQYGVEFHHYRVSVTAQQLHNKKVIALGGFPDGNDFVGAWAYIGCNPEYDCTSCGCSNYVNKNDGTKHYSMSGVNTETGQGINASCNNKGECIF